MSPADTDRKPLKLPLVKPACQGQYEEAWHPNWGFLRFSCVDNHQRVLPEKGFKLCSTHLHGQKLLPELFLLRCLCCPWGADRGADSVGSLAGLQHYDSVSSLHSGPLLQTWVRFTWGNGLFCFLSRCKAGFPSFGSFNNVSSKTANPAAGDGKNSAKELHIDALNDCRH